ncbi:flavin-containing amine oxidoreductase-domain containing protein [Aspergillus multicolor]|uniref:putative lysine-specific histone demethylase Aof2 n=1 Tax=Aspergillus multicolor TaxID=41759 RepID=UPI003CCD4A37
MMEVPPVLAVRAAGSFSSQTETIRPYIPSSVIVHSSEPPAKQPQQPNGVQQHEASNSHPTQNDAVGAGTGPGTLGSGIISNGNDSGNVNIDYMTFDLTTETSGNTPNDSTSTSFPSTSSNGKSSTPSTVVNFTSSATSVSSMRADTPDQTKFRPRSSIPSRLPTAIYAQQCVAAAYASRLNPYALHQKEQEALQDYLCHLHVTVYLNIRNGILRLWTCNPMVSVSREEALGCAKDYRWMNLASFAYEWLVRNGYINFGCLEIPETPVPPKMGRRSESPVIVVIGAGMAGLGCARQLEGFFKHFHDKSTTPRVVVLEGRRRIGGRIYSHPLQSKSSTLPPGLTPKVEMGAQIIVGFDRGNPLDQIIRGQLALPYHLLRDISTIYDIDGTPVDEVRDATAERLYNEVLDRSGDYRYKSVIVPTAQGERDYIDSGRDMTASDGVTVRQYEEARRAGTIGLLFPAKRIRRGVGHKTADLKTAAVPIADVDEAEENPATLACEAMGWKLKEGTSADPKLDLGPIAKASKYQTLGRTMDEGVRQYERMLPLTPKDLRLMNWHFANLEYANATNINNLSLSGWDQDMGNEFEGEHSQVIGGYQRVPFGLWSYPSKLDVRTNKNVSRITYDGSGSSKHKTVVHCEDGDSIAADMVVYTGSLGTLQHHNVQFSPPLPEWKWGAIDRLGFGVMNKVILVFDKPFWDAERDMFGLLREPTNRDSMVQEDYAANRGRFYLFWNCIKTTGLPVLIGLMAGDAAHQAERTPDAEIIAEVMSQLRNVFKQTAVPDPVETIITRWASDKYTRGTYSYVAAEALPGDYDLMAKPVGNLHFAGEATCGTHPATVHGAYISGLRAASEVIDSILGPISVPTPLVPEKGKTANSASSNGTPITTPHIPLDIDLNTPEIPPQQQAHPANPAEQSFASICRDAYDQAMKTAAICQVGEPVQRPGRVGINPFILYQKDWAQKARDDCDAEHQAKMNDPNAKAPRDTVRAVLGQMWRQAPEDVKRPYLEQAEVNRQTSAEIADKWKRDNAEWEKKMVAAKRRWRQANPFHKWVAEEFGEPPRKRLDSTNKAFVPVSASATGATPAVAPAASSQPVLSSGLAGVPPPATAPVPPQSGTSTGLAGIPSTAAAAAPQSSTSNGLAGVPNTTATAPPQPVTSTGPVGVPNTAAAAPPPQPVTSTGPVGAPSTAAAPPPQPGTSVGSVGVSSTAAAAPSQTNTSGLTGASTPAAAAPSAPRPSGLPSGSAGNSTQLTNLSSHANGIATASQTPNANPNPNPKTSTTRTSLTTPMQSINPLKANGHMNSNPKKNWNPNISRPWMMMGFRNTETDTNANSNVHTNANTRSNPRPTPSSHIPPSRANLAVVVPSASTLQASRDSLPNSNSNVRSPGTLEAPTRPANMQNANGYRSPNAVLASSNPRPGMGPRSQMPSASTQNANGLHKNAAQFPNPLANPNALGTGISRSPSMPSASTQNANGFNRNAISGPNSNPIANAASAGIGRSPSMPSVSTQNANGNGYNKNANRGPSPYVHIPGTGIGRSTSMPSGHTQNANGYRPNLIRNPNPPNPEPRRAAPISSASSQLTNELHKTIPNSNSKSNPNLIPLGSGNLNGPRSGPARAPTISSPAPMSVPSMFSSSMGARGQPNGWSSTYPGGPQRFNNSR